MASGVSFVVKKSDHLEDPFIEFSRRPQAVLAADVVGYTRLMEAEELDTHKQLRHLRVEVIDPAIVAHRGEVIKNTGDGYIAIFETPSDAIKCAIVLQRTIYRLQLERLQERRIEFRMGVHWDSVIFDLGDVYGNGVNTAVRLQELAPSNRILISSALHSMIKDISDVEFHDLGDVHLKNFSRRVHAFLIVADKSDRDAQKNNPNIISERTKIPSIAILPFRGSSSAKNGGYFVEGFVEDIVTSLSNLRDLLVVSRDSTMLFRDHPIDSQNISQKLGVQYLVAGRIHRSNKRVRLWVELNDVATDTVIWAERYDIEIEKIFDLQDDIVFKIVGHIASNIHQSEVRRALRKSPDNLNAYDYLLQALDSLYKLDADSFERARMLLETARLEDDSYAAPYSFLAHWHMFNIAEGWSSDVKTDANEIVRLSNCAIQRDPANALAWAVQGQAQAMFFRNYDLALEYVDRATTISPNNSWAWIFSSGPYGFIGETKKAIEHAQHAIRLSPVDQQAFFKQCLLSQNHYLNGTYQDAISWSRKSLSFNPRFGNAARVLVASLVAVDDLLEARRVAKHHSKILPRFTVAEYESRCPFKQPAASIYVERLRRAGISP